MPEYLRSLVVVIFFAVLIFTLSKKAFVSTLSQDEIKRFRNIWLVTTCLAFLSHNFWLFLLFVALYLLYISKRESNKPSLFLLLLFVIPPVSEYIPGLGILNQLFEISLPRLLSLVLLLPVFLSAQAKWDGFKFGKTLPDKFFITFIILCTVLQVRSTTFTDTLRFGFYLFTDAFLPYYAFSRGLRSFHDIKKASIALICASLIAALIGLFEYLKHWLIYVTLPGVLNSNWHFGSYMLRGGDIRAMASLMHPIILGYLMVVCLGFYFYLSPSIKNKNYRLTGLLTIVGGLFSTLSRGPWLGGIILAVAYLATGKKPILKLLSLTIFTSLFIAVLTVVPGGEKFYNFLPYLGKTQSENIDYREKLYTNSKIVIDRSPLFGSVNFLQTPEMREMVQGEGIVDIVNTYIGVALTYGYVGLILFVGVFLSIIYKIYKIINKLQDKDSEKHLLGRCLISTIVGLMVVISTASGIGIVPTLYWAVAGMGVAYIRLVEISRINI